MGASVMKDLEYYIMAGLGCFLVLVNSFTLLPSGDKPTTGTNGLFIFFCIAAIYTAILVLLLFTDFSGESTDGDKKDEKQEIDTAINIPPNNNQSNSGDQAGELLPAPAN